MLGRKSVRRPITKNAFASEEIKRARFDTEEEEGKNETSYEPITEKEEFE